MAAMARSVSISARTSLVQGKQLRTAKRAAAPQASRQVAVTAAARPLWFPGTEAPAHLDGTLPGDFGFDPLGLGAEPEMLKWFQQAELMHCRWAMIGTTGILIPELVTKMGYADFPVWFEAGEKANAASDIPGYTLFWIQMILMNWVEVRRWRDMKNPGSVNKDPIFDYSLTSTEPGYPGGMVFNPANFTMDDEQMKLAKTREIKNGRLAMVAMVGFATQAFVTGKGPVDNWLSHLADPGHTTIFQQMGL